MRCDVRLSLSPRYIMVPHYISRSTFTEPLTHALSGISAIRRRSQPSDRRKQAQPNGNTRRADCAYVLPVPAGSSVAPAVHTHPHPLVSRVRPHLPPTIQTRRRRLVALHDMYARLPSPSPLCPLSSHTHSYMDSSAACFPGSHAIPHMSRQLGSRGAIATHHPQGVQRW